MTKEERELAAARMEEFLYEMIQLNESNLYSKWMKYQTLKKAGEMTDCKFGEFVKKYQ